MNKTEMEFNNLIGELTDEEYKDYIASWFDNQLVVDIMNDWDEDVKTDAIKELKQIVKNRKGTQLKINFNESLSDSGITQIKSILKDSLGYNTKIEEVYNY